MACGSDSGSSSFHFTSSSDLNHTHTVDLASADVSTPPAAGRTETTSNDDSHTHTVALTEADSDNQFRGLGHHHDVRGRDAGVRPHPQLRLPQVEGEWSRCAAEGVRVSR